MAIARAKNVGMESLIALGLTPLEAEVYAFLLGESPATGYRVAQALGKPFGSIYKTIEALQTKGAVLTAEEGDNRVVRAVQVNELLGQFTRTFKAQRRAVREALHGTQREAADDRVYEIHTAEQFYERVRRTLKSARQFAIASCTPGPLTELTGDFAQAAGRGIAVGVKTFEPETIAGVRTVLDPRGLAAVESGPGQWAYLSVDGQILASAIFTPDGVALHQGFWSANALLGWSYYTGLSSDFVLVAVRAALRDGADAAAISELIASFAPFETPRSLGKRSLTARFRRAGRKRQPSKTD
jgi:sugar-specific transcriptional regulator TrmB